MVQAAAREAVVLVENRVAEDKPQAGEEGRRSGSSWMADTEDDIVAVHKEAAVRTATGAALPPAGTGRIQSGAGAGNSRNTLVVAAVGKRPEDKPGSRAAVAEVVVHQEDRPVVAADRTLL